MMSGPGALVLVLHAHLPWVRHPELPFYMEEHWLYEAIAETYLPLIEALRALERDGVPARLTIDVSPTVAAMLDDALLRERTLKYFDNLLGLVAKEKRRTAGDDGLHPVVLFYEQRLERLRALFVEIDRHIPGELARLEQVGLLELATCAGTHPLLPMLMERPGLVRGHVRTAVREHRRLFGRSPRGIWLPECAYAPGLDRYLAEADLRWFIVDAHGLLAADPTPLRGVHAPVYTEYGVAAFARDLEPARQVWSAEAGYPGDPLYREFYRDVGWDLPLEQVREHIDPDGTRMFTGLKYYRITGRGDHREPYHPGWARQRAHDHAGHFFDCRVADARRLAERLGVPAVITSPYDAELFGHWWFEGPWFLESLLRKIAYDTDLLDALSPMDVLERWPEQQVVALEASTWGAGGYFDVWLGASNEWCMPHLVGVGERFISQLRRLEGRDAASDRVLAQMAREMMLAQSSDWPFLMSTGTAVDYARRRFIEHVQRFNRLDAMLESGQIDEEFLALCEQRDGLFPSLELADFA
ncbi:MAG TPA: DUF1957 domain-containing protein [Acidobacteria bacterium]|nr:DUF1957 domain-containing protein [Acidobacteriota bacterium]